MWINDNQFTCKMVAVKLQPAELEVSLADNLPIYWITRIFRLRRSCTSKFRHLILIEFNALQFVSIKGQLHAAASGSVVRLNGMR